MVKLWEKIKILLCCGQEDEESPALVIGEPYGFRHVNIDLPGLSEEDRAMIDARPTASLLPLRDGSTTMATTPPGARLDRARAHTRALSNSFMASVGGIKISGYSALANGSASTMQAPRSNNEEVQHETKELLHHSIGGAEGSTNFAGK